MEVSSELNPQTKRYRWMISQETYVTDLLATEEEPKKKKTPISRDQAAMEEDEQPPAPEPVRLAQKLVSELLWLVTRTRPDLMCSVSRMGSSVIKSPKAVKEAADQVRGYLWSTRSQH